MFVSHAHSTKQCFQKKKKNSKQCTEVLNQTATTNTSNFGTGPTFPIKMYFPLNVHIRIFFFWEEMFTFALMLCFTLTSMSAKQLNKQTVNCQKVRPESWSLTSTSAFKVLFIFFNQNSFSAQHCQIFTPTSPWQTLFHKLSYKCLWIFAQSYSSSSSSSSPSLGFEP